MALRWFLLRSLVIMPLSLSSSVPCMAPGFFRVGPTLHELIRLSLSSFFVWPLGYKLRPFRHNWVYFATYAISNLINVIMTLVCVVFNCLYIFFMCLQINKICSPFFVIFFICIGMGHICINLMQHIY